MSKLSVLYIVRNEEALIEQSLKSIQPIADEIVIVDTGSFDKTLATCRKFNYVRIYSHAWSHDFSKTKNYGIKQCKGDWILSMDADEALDASSASAIRTAVNNAKTNIAGFGLHIADHEQSLDPMSPINPKSFFPSPQTRLFRRHARVFFQGRVSEKADEMIKTVGGIDLLDAKIHHFLWRGKGPDYRDGRLKYYEKLGVSIPIPSEGQEAIRSEAPVIKIQTGIVVPLFNALHLTKDCISSIACHTKGGYSLHPVDNGSSDGTFEYIKNITGKTPQRFLKNNGVARAKNAGAREALALPQTQYICFLDNDAKVSEGWLDDMVGVMERNPKIGILGPLSNSASGPQNLYTHSNDATKPLGSREPEFFHVDAVDGFCMLVRSELARKIGLFDETFGLYGFEEKDFCRRAKDAGYEIGIANRVFIDHKGRGAMQENKLDWHKLEQLAWIKYSQKWTIPPEKPSGPRSPAIPRLKNSDNQRFSFVILTHNRLDVTKDCIESILSTSSNYELILIDNASTDGTVEWLKSRVPFAKIIENKENLGVVKARNQGLKLTTADLVVMMDNDVVLQPGWFQDMSQPLREGYDIVGIEGWQLDHNWAASWKCQKPHERFDYLGGACNIFKRKVFETAGLLDEGFSPAYYEDVDLCIRAKRAGFKLAWVPSNKIFHKEHSTLVHGQKQFSYQEAISRSHTRFAKKMRGELIVPHENLPKAERTFNIMYLGMQYDYGVRDRGESFEHANFYPALKEWRRTRNFEHFDFVDLGKTYGVQRMSEALLDRVRDFKPDILFSVFFDENHDPKRDVMRQISSMTKTVGWFCDSHFRYDNFDRPWADFLNYNVTTSAAAYDRYVREGLGNKVIKSQWFAAPPYKNLGIPQDISVTFVGQPHGDRRQVIDQIKNAGVDIQTYGTGWAQRLTFDGMIQIFNRSKINLNLNNACDVRFKQIKGRNFEVPACGGFLLTGHAENLQDYYEIGKEIVTFTTTEDMIEKIKYYLSHDAEREAIAKAGYERTIRDHTFASRMDDIVSKIGII